MTINQLNIRATVAQPDQLIRKSARLIINQVNIRATVAQLVEQLIRNQQVAGSNPASSSKNTARMQQQRLYFL